MINKRNPKTLSLLVLMSLLVSACSYIPGAGYLVGDERVFRDRGGDYLEAESIPRLEIPGDLDGFVIDDLLVIPDLASLDGQAFVDVPRPRPLPGNPDRAVVIQRLDDLSWVLVESRASQVWPRVRQYWLERGIELSQESPNQGMLETIWFSSEENTGYKEKIRVSVRAGFQDDSAELSLTHVSAPLDADVPEQFDWPEQPEDSDYAYQVLTDISTYLADQIRLYQSSTVSFLAGSIPDEGRASMQTRDNQMVLHLDADYLRSWAAVGRALDRAEVEIFSEDMDGGFFNVAFNMNAEPEERRGLFSRLNPLRNREPGIPLRISLVQTENGIDVIAERTAAGQTNASTGSAMTEEQYAELRNALLQTIQNFIS
jgi:outer membrane protein assembly factor BamC